MLFNNALARYIKHLKSDEKNELTIKNYSRDIGLFRDSYKQNDNDSININIDAVQSEEIETYLNYYEKNHSVATNNRMKSSLRMFFDFLVKEDILKSSPMKNISNKKPVMRIPKYLKKNETQILTRVIKNDSRAIVFRTILAIFIYAGLRISELVNLKLDSIQGSNFHVVGKRNKLRIVPINDKLAHNIDEYLKWRETITNAPEYLFFSNRCKKYSVRMIQHKMAEFVKKTGVKNKSITPHSLRHTFATNYYEKTKDILMLKELLGHESISTTQIYTHTDTEAKRKSMNQMDDEDV